MIHVSQKKFGQYLRASREKKGLTREELAERLAVTDDAVAKWERGVRYPDFEMLANISQELDMNLQELRDYSVDSDSNSPVINAISIAIISCLLAGLMIMVVFALRHPQKEPTDHPAAPIETTAVETTTEEVSDATSEVASTGFQGPCANYCIFHDGAWYYPEESDYIAKCPSMEKATYLGEITTLSGDDFPEEELQAAHFDIGDKVYELEGTLWVVQKTHYHKMYRSDSLK